MQLQSFKEYFTTLSDHGKELIIKELLNILESNAEINPHCSDLSYKGYFEPHFS
jgi:hypothetical protein